MAIPKEILAVERPKGTIVKYSFGKYYVVKRTSKRVPGKKNPVPFELGTVGEIIDGKFVEKKTLPKKTKQIIDPDLKDYGEVALVDKEAKSLLDELKKVYDDYYATVVYVIAVLRTAYPDVSDRDLEFVYRTSYLSEMYPGVPLSENTVSANLQNLGMLSSKIEQFMVNRMIACEDHPQVIDGMLVSNNSTTNSYSEWSRKARIKGTMDDNLLYLYDQITQEPIAAKCYQGNMNDNTAAKDFIKYCGFQCGEEMLWMDVSVSDDNTIKIPQRIFSGDKGFYSTELTDLLEDSHIPYLLPIKNDSSFITKYDLTKTSERLYGYKDAEILCKKVQLDDNHWLFSFKDLEIENIQRQNYVKKRDKDKSFEYDDYMEDAKKFGLIVFISNVDLSPLAAYLVYEGRWNIEPVFYIFKDVLLHNTVNVQGDYRLLATQFINYLSTIMACRLKKLFRTTVIRKVRAKSLDDGNDEVGTTQKGDTKSTKKTKRKTEDKKIYVSDDYSFYQVMRLLSKKKYKRSIKDREKWKPEPTLVYIEHLLKVLGV